MSRNRPILHRDLEQYEDELMDTVEDRIRDQEEDRDPEISRLRLNFSNLFTAAASVMETLYFDDEVSVRTAISDAASMVVNASIYANLKRDRALDLIDRDVEETLKDDFLDVEEIIGNRSSRSRDRERESRRDSRRDAAGTSRRSSDRGRDRDDRDRGRGRERRDDRNERSRDNVRERNTRRDTPERNTSDQARDKVVEQAQQSLEENTKVRITAELVKANPKPFQSKDKKLALAPVYWVGSQIPVLLNNEITFEKVGEEVEWEKHRTDLYLAVRKSVKPSANIRDEVLTRSMSARDKFVENVVQKLTDEANVVTEKVETEFKQLITSDTIAGQFYGAGTPMAKIQTCLESLNLKYLPSHPVIMKIEEYPMWVMNKELTDAVEDLLNVTNLNALIPALIKVSNKATPQQWTYFHDKTTLLINEILKVELEVKPYLNSIITEWQSFAKWIENYNNGSLVLWFSNNLNAAIRRVFHVYKAGGKLSHALVDGTDEKYASVSGTTRVIYLPTASENFGAGSATKLGRVLESVTPKLYQLLAANVDTTCTSNLLVTSSDESVNVYSRASALTSKVILMGEVNW